LRLIDFEATYYHVVSMRAYITFEGESKAGQKKPENQFTSAPTRAKWRNMPPKANLQKTESSAASQVVQERSGRGNLMN
jgi:hypothetical protein